MQSLRYGFRVLLQNKTWTAIAIASLAIGIGACTALFSVVDSILIQTLPVQSPENLVLLDWTSGPRTMGRISGTSMTDAGTRSIVSPSFSTATFERFRAESRSLSAVIAFRATEFSITADERSELVSGQLVSGNYFSSLGALPILGREIVAEDDSAAAEPVAVISYDYFRRRFNSDRNVLGRSILLNGVAFTVTGVAPPGFKGVRPLDDQPHVSIPLSADRRINSRSANELSPLDDAGAWWLMIMGRLRDGARADQVRAELDSILSRTAQESWDVRLSRMPAATRATVDLNRDMPVLRVLSGSRGFSYYRDYSQTLVQQSRLMTAIVAAILLIVSANVANLLLGRANTRRNEVVIRVAIGATRLQLMRQFLVESILLALCGGLLGYVFALWTRDIFWTWIVGEAIPMTAPAINARAFAFMSALSAIIGLVFGFAPAWQLSRTNPTFVHHGSGLFSSGRSFMSKSILVVQVAVSVVLLIGMTLFVRTLFNLTNTDVGFNRQNLSFAQVDAERAGISPTEYASVAEQIAQRVEAIPGVNSVTLTEEPPLSRSGSGDLFAQAGRTPGEKDRINKMRVRNNFFTVMDIPILLGRGFRDNDNANSSKVAVISESIAREYFPNANPIGQFFVLGRPDLSRQIEIIGVAKDTHHLDIRGAAPRTVFLPFGQSPAGAMTFIIRTSSADGALTAPVTRAIADVDARLPVYGLQTQDAQLNELLRRERLFAISSSFFGAIALLLTCIGLYGVISYRVGRRTQEIGLRMALGAKRSEVLTSVLRETLFLLALGIVIGLTAAFALTPSLASMLYGVAPNDPLSILIALLLLTMAATFGGYLPARRAARVDPIVALRHL